MKTAYHHFWRACTFLYVAFILVVHPQLANSEIRNGYRKDIEQLQSSLASLKIAAANAGACKPAARHRLNARIAAVEEKIAFYKLTEVLLEQFRSIAPDVYAEIDSIRDRQQRSVDVYVKFVPCNSTAVAAWGTTYLAQGMTDEDAYLSEYGEHTVSIKIWTVKCALLVLAHEFGHVCHQVPHLANYAAYHALHYGKSKGANDVGHDLQDPSGISALAFEHRFQKHFSTYNKHVEKYKNPVVLLDEIRRNINQQSLCYRCARRVPMIAFWVK